MRTIGIGREPTKDGQDDSLVVVEHQDGFFEIITGTRRELGLITHEESRQVFPERPRVPEYRLSLDGDYAELDGDVDYYDDELTDPVYDPSFVFGSTVAACEAAERGELGEPETVKSHARVQWIAALGGVGFMVIAALGAVAMPNGLPW